MEPSGRSAWEETVLEVLSAVRGRRPRNLLKTESTFFFRTDRQRKVNDSFIIFFPLVFFLPLFRQWRGKKIRKKNQDRYQYCKKLVTRIRFGPLWCLKNDELAESWRIISQFGWRQTLHFVELNLSHPEYTCMGWSRWGRDWLFKNTA